MEYQTVLEDDEDTEEGLNKDDLHLNLEDHLYEEWRDNKALSEKRE